MCFPNEVANEVANDVANEVANEGANEVGPCKCKPLAVYYSTSLMTLWLFSSYIV